MLWARHGRHVFDRVDGVASIVRAAPVTAAITIGHLGAVVLLSRLTYQLVRLARRFGRWPDRARK